MPCTLPSGLNFDYSFEHTRLDRKTLRRVSKPYDFQPECNLLSRLPAELRNMMYEQVCADQETFSICDEWIAAPPLGRVCRQIEREFSALFVHEAPKWAPKFRLYVTDFEPSVSP